MKQRQPIKVLGATTSLVGVALAMILTRSPAAQAEDDWNDNEGSRIKIGLEITPVPLNLNGKDRNLVGLGSYWVNAVSDCNFCHTSGGPPNFNYANGRNPYFGQKKKTDPTAYLAGGTDFAPAVPPIPGIYLQVMPWRNMQDISEHDIEALYEDLSAIPCIDNASSPPPAGAPNELRNDCGDDPQVGSPVSHSAASRRAKP